MANRDPVSGVATIAINARSTPQGRTITATAKTMNVQKPRTGSTTVFLRCLPLAPSARAGSERPAAATIMRITRPTQKIGEGHDVELPQNKDQSVVFNKSRKMATRAPEQTTSEARPAPAASATRSQTLCTATPQARPDGRHTSGL